MPDQIKKIPAALILSRLLIGIMLIVISLLHVANFAAIAVILLSIGLLTDIFDGIIARHLKISTQYLRRMDSVIDQLFFIAAAIATYIHCREFFRRNSSMLIILIGSEALIYIVSFMKFRKEVATHSIGAKIWTLFLFATLVEVIIHCQSNIIFPLCFWIGLITRAEIIAILLILKQWTNDVPGIYQAIQLRKGKSIRRHKLFNG